MVIEIAFILFAALVSGWALGNLQLWWVHRAR